MDPITLFMMANSAVAAVKKGCQLYKDIKSAAGDVKDVLKDMDDQFKKLHPPDKPATNEQKKQFIEEKERIKTLNQSDPGDAYDQIAEQLSVYFENYAKCIAIFEQQEANAQEVYDGDASVGKRALQRVVMRKKLEHMGVELREMLVYQSPPELGGLYTDVSQMMEKISAEQTVAIAKKMQQEERDRKRRIKRLAKLRLEIAVGLAGLTVSAIIGLALAMVVQDRIEKYPHLGNGWVPKTERQRYLDSLPKHYIGR